MDSFRGFDSGRSETPLDSINTETTTSSTNGLSPLVAVDQSPAVIDPHNQSDGNIQPPFGTATLIPANRNTEEPIDYLFEPVFLSHSGKQKKFVEELYLDLKKADISCFFDKYCLPKGKEFPQLILSAAKNCRIAVVVLSEDFITSKWPMQELCTFVNSRKDANPKLEILPLFYKMSPAELSQKIRNIEKEDIPESWAMSSSSSINRIDGLNALKALRSINGAVYNEMDGEESYRRQIVSDIHKLLPARNLKYADGSIKGKARLCQEVKNLFQKAPYFKNGVKVIGLYGIGGSGKTTICKSVCDFYFDEFDGKVFHAEFGKDDSIKTLKQALRALTQVNETVLKSITSAEQGLRLLTNHRVFLAVDNISADGLQSIQQAQAYLTASLGEGSLILLTARSTGILESVIPQAGKRLFKHVPSLNEEEAIQVLLKPTSVESCSLTEEQKRNARRCLALCHFRRRIDPWRQHLRDYHPLVLQTLGASLCEKFTCDLSRWIEVPNFEQYAMGNDAQENIFKMFEESFNALHPRYLHIFMLLIFYVPDFREEKIEIGGLSSRKKDFDSICKWIANVCYNEEDQTVCDAIHALKKKGLIESCEPIVSIHDLLVEFAETKLKSSDRWMSPKTEENVPITSRVEAIKFQYCDLRSVRAEKFSYAMVVHLECMPNLKWFDFGSMKSARSIAIIECDALEEIGGLTELSDLRYLQVQRCKSLVKCPGIEGLTGLRYLEVETCGGIADITQCLSLEEAYLCGFSRVKLPKLQHWRNIRTVYSNNFHDCEDVIGALDVSGYPKLRSFRFLNCERGVSLKLTRCQQLRTTDADACENVTPRRSDPNPTARSNVESIHWRSEHSHSVNQFVGFDRLTALESLYLSGMGNLEWLPTLQRLTNLSDITLSNMPKLKELPDFSPLIHLRELSIERCGVTEPSELTNCRSLVFVRMVKCESLRRWPNFSGLTALTTLELRQCKEIVEPPNVTGCNGLSTLIIADNGNMVGLPCISDCESSLMYLDLTWHKDGDVRHFSWRYRPYNASKAMINDWQGEDIPPQRFLRAMGQP